MKIVGLAAVVTLVLASVAIAEVTYTITLSDEDAAIIVEQTKILNIQNQRAAKPAPEITPEKTLYHAMYPTLRQWRELHDRAVEGKPWLDRTAAQKARHCVRQGIKPDDCPK